MELYSLKKKKNKILKIYFYKNNSIKAESSRNHVKIFLTKYKAVKFFLAGFFTLYKYLLLSPL